MTTGTTTCAECERLCSEVKHWKKNHDNRVDAARFLVEREDLPPERVRTYEKYVDLLSQIIEFENWLFKNSPPESEARREFQQRFKEYLP